jgi:biopolymer transport protein ExbB/TolQ
MSPITYLANWLLRLPLLWGGLATLATYAVLRSGYVTDETTLRYFDSHWVEVAATLMFFTGLASLTLRLTSIATQFGAVRLNPLGPAPEGGQPASDAPLLIERLDALSAPLRRTAFVHRLRLALEYVADTGSADTLETHLERLENVEREKAFSGYALPKLVRATLPIVGMLGTVIGITMAIGQLSPDNLEQSLNDVLGSLAIAFDTTAQAMILMLVLWFFNYSVERVEELMLDGVDHAVARQLVGRFHVYGSATDPSVAAIRRMGDQVLAAVEQVADRQASTWQTAIDETHERWRSATTSAGELLTTTLANGLREGLRDHATGLTSGVEKQLAGLAGSLNKQQELVAGAVREQLAALQSLQQEHARALRDSSVEQTGRLVASADGLLGNLRDGLERMAELLVEALQKHGETLTAAENELATENRRHLSEVEAAMGEAMVVAADRQEKLVRQSESMLREMQQALVASAGATIQQQGELVKQGEVLLKVVESAGQVAKLEETLNRNLSSLGRAHNFEETLMNLSAAIQLLSARVGRESARTVLPTVPTTKAA